MEVLLILLRQHMYFIHPRRLVQTTYLILKYKLTPVIKTTQPTAITGSIIGRDSIILNLNTIY